MSQTFPKKEKLKSRKKIELLFSKGSWVVSSPLKLLFLKVDNEGSQIGVSVSKKSFKKAVDRNYIKRLLRDCHRINKNLFEKIFTQPHYVMIIYSHDKILDYKEIEKAYLKLLNNIK